MTPFEIALAALKKFWPYIAVGIAVLVVVGIIYHAGGVGPRAELAKYRAEVAGAAKMAEAAAAEKKKQSELLTKQMEAKHDEDKKQIVDDWSNYTAYLAGLLKRPGGSAGEKSIRPVAEVCNDQAANDRLSDALQRYRDEYRSAIGRERLQIAGFLEACQLQTKALVEVQEWAIQERLLNVPLDHPAGLFLH